MGRLKDRRRAQAGTTLIELLVSLVIAGLALAIIVGTLSTGLLNSTLAKRNTAIQAVMQYETDSVFASAFSLSDTSYSECFATENTSSPARTTSYPGACASGQYSLQADVTCQPTCGNSVQTWTITVTALPSGAKTVDPIQVYKVPHS
jgi:prepilin-type N-terminal cleavage/methylation domain-containing protein